MIFLIALVLLVVVMTTGAYAALGFWFTLGLPWPGSSRTTEDQDDYKTIGAVALYTTVIPCWLATCWVILDYFFTHLKG